MCKKRVRGKGRKQRNSGKIFTGVETERKSCFRIPRSVRWTENLMFQALHVQGKREKITGICGAGVTRTVQESERILRICEYSILRKTH